MRKCAIIGAVVSVGVGLGGSSMGAVLSPSSDAFVYQGLPALPMVQVGLGDILASGRSGSGHTTQSYLKFNLAGTTVNPTDTATLRLWVRNNVPDPGTGAPQFGVQPTPEFPIQVDVAGVAADWSKGTLSWLNRPSGTTPLVDSESISGINRWVEFDVTSAVLAWSANPSSNKGLLLSSPSVVTPVQGQTVYAIFNGLLNAGGNTPQLVITAIPEPSSLGLLAGTLALGLRRRRA